MKKIFTPLEITKAKKNYKESKSLTGFIGKKVTIAKKNYKESKSLTGFIGKKVTIMGLGLHGGGVGTVKFFCRQGAKVLVTDLKTKSQLKESFQKLKGLPIKFVLGRHCKEDFINADLIVKNPGVPRESSYLKIAKKHKIPIKTDVNIFFDLCQALIIGITGTKGKSTVATLIYLLLKTKYPNTVLAGNIGVSPLEILSKIDEETIVVLELSSFELEDLKKSPQVAVITNLFPDHLNRYKNFKAYIKAKESIFKYQKRNDILVLNYNNFETRKFVLKSHSKVHFFKGSNDLAAIAVAKIFKIPEKNIKKVLSNFKGVSSRQELIATKKEVRYINDTTATTPQSVILAIGTFKKRFPKSKIILIAGGSDKNLNYRNLAKEIKNNVSCLILLPGTASNKIEKELGSFFKEPSSFKVRSIKEAVKKASKQAKKGDIVLLSPGAASFNLFKNEFDRGKQFIKSVKNLF